MQLYKKITTISSFITISIANLTLEKRYDFARIEKGIVSKVITPTNKEELCNAVRTTQGRIAIAGGKFSMGGHTWINGGTVIDMHRYNRVLAFDKETQIQPRSA